MPTTRIYPIQSHATLTAALPQLVRFLINDHSSFTGPNWTFVETYTGGEGRRGGTSFWPNKHDLDSLQNGWASGSISNGDWVVLESADANNTNHFQLYIELESSTTVNFMMIPFEDFVVQGDDVSPPQFPTTSFGNASGSFTVMTFAGGAATGLYTIVADEGMMNLFCQNAAGSQAGWHFAGETNPVMATGTIGDRRSYIMKRTTATISWPTVANSNFFARTSPFDNITVLTSSAGCHMAITAGDVSGMLHDGIGQDVLNQTIYPVSVFFNDLNHKHFAGWFRNLYSVHGDISPKSGTISTPNSGNFMFFSNGSTPAQLCVSWGTASYSSASLGHFIDHSFASMGRFSNYIVDTFGTIELSTNTVQTVAVLPSGSFDRQRMKITYPFRRVRPRYGNVSG